MALHARQEQRCSVQGARADRSQLPSALSFYKLPVRICSATYSEARIESARIVSVGFCDPPTTKLLPSTTKRFFTSWLWFHLLSTLVRGLSPIRHVPNS